MKTNFLKQENRLFEAVEGMSKGDIILFGSFTPPWEGGGGGGGEPTFPGSDPFPGGDPGGGGVGGGCAGYGAWLTNGSSVSDDLISEVPATIDATHRTITYTWIPFRGPLNIWRYESREVATQELIGGNWEFTNISHLGVTLAGTTTGFTLQYADIIPPDVAVFSSSTAYSELKFRVRAVFYCGGSPFEFEFTPSPYGNARRTFTV